MIAQQVAGKAARDALYLSSFRVETLPVMMAAAAVFSLLAAVWMSRLMVRYSPARVVPIAFAVSGVAFLLEWGLSFQSRGYAAIALYVHTGLFGAVIISAFWSLINETFPPHTGRSAVAWIAGGGTIGGTLGGLTAWAASGVIAVPTMLPLLAGVNLICLGGVIRLRSADGSTAHVESEDPHAPTLAPLRVLRDAPYLQNLALVVLLGALISGLLDYVFSSAAVKRYPEGHELLAFFAVFWLLVGVVSFGLQVLLGRIAIEKLGVAVTVGILPGVVVLAGALGLAVPGLATAAVLRGVEATEKNSLFRVAYEQLYTPLSGQTKRSTKTLIDVGFDRLGTVSASLIALGALYFAPGRTSTVLVVVVMGCALLSMARSRALSRGYVAMLEESLKKAANGMEPASESSPPAQEKIAVRDKIVEHLDDLGSEGPAQFAVATPQVEPVPSPAISASDASLVTFVGPVADLTSGDVRRIQRILGAKAPLATPLVAFAILLLADKEVHVDAIRALRKVPRATGQLADALCDPDMSFDVRRRIPRVLSTSATQLAADGLFRGLDDNRFEVRYACGRALLKIAPDPGVNIDLERVIAAVEIEVKRAKPVWESQAMDDDEDEPRRFERLLNDQIDRSMEHVFNILALHLDPESLRTAFNALHTEDVQVRGTALEYLETVLPLEVRDLVWPFLGEERPMREARPAKEILEDLVRLTS